MKKKFLFLAALFVFAGLGGCSQPTERTETHRATVSVTDRAEHQPKPSSTPFLLAGKSKGTPPKTEASAIKDTVQEITKNPVSTPSNSFAPIADLSERQTVISNLPAPVEPASRPTTSPASVSRPISPLPPAVKPTPISTLEPTQTPVPTPGAMPDSTPEPTLILTPEPTSEPEPDTGWDYDTVISVAISNCAAEWNEKAMESGCTSYSSDSAGSAEDMGLLIAATVNRSGRQYFYVETNGDYWYVYK